PPSPPPPSPPPVTAAPTGAPTATPTVSVVNVTVVSTTASFSSVDMSALSDATYRAEFESSVKSQLATAAGTSTSDINILSITSGSVNVNVEVAFYPTTADDTAVYSRTQPTAQSQPRQ
ncbi:hypothetical protein CYMTET_35314, partial [Cymbomonas tetramitiformis]